MSSTKKDDNKLRQLNTKIGDACDNPEEYSEEFWQTRFIQMVDHAADLVERGATDAR